MSSIDPIRAYYDRNTQLFLRFGSRKEVQTIHRALWLDGVANLQQALNAANALILAQAQYLFNGRETLGIADMGCGVGATLLYLLTDLEPDAYGVGLTISPLQAQIGGRIFRMRKIHGLIVEADFQRLPLTDGFHLAYAVESFVHAFEPERFMAEAARILHGAVDGKPGGRLILIDDFSGAAPADQGREKWLDLYRRGWYIKNLISQDDLVAMAARFELRLVENRLLTPYLRLRVIPDLPAQILENIFLPFWGLHPIVPSMLGSMALQKCLQNGLVEYRWMVFEKL